MGRDEQAEEREVLDSIFPDEITDVSATEYRVSIQLEVDNKTDEDETIDRTQPEQCVPLPCSKD